MKNLLCVKRTLESSLENFTIDVNKKQKHRKQEVLIWESQEYLTVRKKR
jgi:hypothetical protein